METVFIDTQARDYKVFFLKLLCIVVANVCAINLIY